MRGIQRGISTLFLVVAILTVTIAASAGYFVFSQNLKEKVASINSFEECAKHYPVMESYPEQCNTPDGKHFTRQLSEEEKAKLEPQTTSPIVITDSAKSCLSPKIDPHITGFVNSDNPEQFAETYDIDFKDNKIRVDMTIIDGKNWSGNRLIEVESTFGSLIEGRVKLEDICKLTELPEVTYIRLPDRSVPL